MLRTWLFFRVPSLDLKEGESQQSGLVLSPPRRWKRPCAGYVRKLPSSLPVARTSDAIRLCCVPGIFECARALLLVVVSFGALSPPSNCCTLYAFVPDVVRARRGLRWQCCVCQTSCFCWFLVASGCDSLPAPRCPALLVPRRFRLRFASSTKMDVLYSYMRTVNTRARRQTTRRPQRSYSKRRP